MNLGDWWIVFMLGKWSYCKLQQQQMIDWQLHVVHWENDPWSWLWSNLVDFCDTVALISLLISMGLFCFCFCFFLQAIVALTFAMYILKPFFPDCDPPTESVRLLAAVCICTVSVLFFFLFCYLFKDFFFVLPVFHVTCRLRLASPI